MNKMKKYPIAVLTLTLMLVATGGYAFYLRNVVNSQDSSAAILKTDMIFLKERTDELLQITKSDTEDLTQSAIEFTRLKGKNDELAAQIVAFSKQAMACEKLKAIFAK